MISEMEISLVLSSLFVFAFWGTRTHKHLHTRAQPHTHTHTRTHSHTRTHAHIVFKVCCLACVFLSLTCLLSDGFQRRGASCRQCQCARWRAVGMSVCLSVCASASYMLTLTLLFWNFTSLGWSCLAKLCAGGILYPNWRAIVIYEWIHSLVRCV